MLPSTPEQRRDAKTNYHLPLVGRTGQKGGGHTVTAHLIELQAQEHRGAHNNNQYSDHCQPLENGM